MFGVNEREVDREKSDREEDRVGHGATYNPGREKETRSSDPFDRFCTPLGQWGGHQTSHSLFPPWAAVLT